MVFFTISKTPGNYRLIACGFLLTLCGPLFAQFETDTTPGEPTILSRSPFIPPDWEPPQTNRPKAVSKKSSTGYEFRGVYQLGEEYRFLVSTPRKHDGKWVAVNTEYEDYSVRGYNPSTETLTLFYEDKEENLKLEKMDANPTPMAVSGQVRKTSPGDDAGKARPARRTIRPSSRSTTDSSAQEPGAAPPPPPAWLQKLREEAAQRRQQAGSGMNASGQPPTGTPPAPPPELFDIVIPPAPEGPPPAPPPEVYQQIQNSINAPFPGT